MSEIPTRVRTALEDYQISTTTRDADRIDATKKDLLHWFEQNLRKEVAPLVSAAVKPYNKVIEDLSSKVDLLQRDIAVLMMAHGEAAEQPLPPSTGKAPRGGDEAYDRTYDDRTSRNVYPAAPDGHDGSDDDPSDRSRRSRRNSRKVRDRRRRDRDRDDRRRSDEYSSEELDGLSQSDSDFDRGGRVGSFRPWKPTDHRYHKACDYRTYRLRARSWSSGRANESKHAQEGEGP